VGSSGTIRSVGDVIRVRNNGDGVITPAAVDALIEHAVKAGDVSKLRLVGLSEERLPVFAGGLAIPGRDPRRLRHQDRCASPTAHCARVCCTTWSAASPTKMPRARSVRAMQARYHVDTAQAERVEASRWIFCVRRPVSGSSDEPFAELVLSVGHAAARDRPGRLAFALSQARRVSARARRTCRDFRRKSSESSRPSSARTGARCSVRSLQDLTPPWHIKAEYLIVLLRLAVLLHRGRSATALPKLELHAKGRSLEIVFPKGWLDAHPLTATDLENEIEYLKAETSGCASASRCLSRTHPRNGAAAFPEH
jgi:exopolyphosphatase/guanosine-5'-triphosphate,3'-diphosphate pyrophosphatase